MPRVPDGYVDTAKALHITGVSRPTLHKAALAGQVPGAIQRQPNKPWYFTEAGLRAWMGVRDDLQQPQPAGIAS